MKGVPATHPAVRRCLCAAVAVSALTLPSARAESKRYLKQELSLPEHPFDAALSGEAPPAQYGSYRYLGRETDALPASAVIFADESQTDDATTGDGNGIEQTQYPLVEPPADEAPDEPARLSPHPTAPSPRITVSELRGEVTSLLGSGDELGITTLTVRGILESPRFKAFSIRPIFGLHAIAGPTRTDLPGQLHDFSIEARIYWPFGDRWLGEFAVAPGIFSDFENTSGDALRIVGRGIGYYKCSDALRLAIGLAYLDRQDIALLPLGGVIWTPNPDWRYEIMLPRPRIAHRYWADGDHERWCYLLGEFGGGSWAIERANGLADVATIRDYRLILGLEFKYESGAAWNLEAGYVFNRQLEYATGIGDFDPAATGLVRAGLTY